MSLAVSKGGIFISGTNHRLYQWHSGWAPVTFDTSEVGGASEVYGVSAITQRALPFLILKQPGVAAPGGTLAAMLARTVNGVSQFYVSPVGQPQDCVRKLSGSDWKHVWVLGCTADSSGNYPVYRVDNSDDNRLSLYETLTPFAPHETTAAPTAPATDPGRLQRLDPGSLGPPVAPGHSIVAGIDISVADDGTLYLVRAAHTLWSLRPTAASFVRLPDVPDGGATRVSATGRVLAVVANDGTPNDNFTRSHTGHHVYRWDQPLWVQQSTILVDEDYDSSMVELAADRTGRLWATDTTGAVYNQLMFLTLTPYANHREAGLHIWVFDATVGDTVSVHFSDNNTTVQGTVSPAFSISGLDAFTTTHSCVPGHTVQVTATDATDGKIATGSVVCPALLPNHAPTVQLAASAPCKAPCTVTFTATGNDADDKDAAQLSYHWSGCAPANNNGTTASCTLNQAGTVSASVSVTDPLGASSNTATASQTVSAPDKPVEPQTPVLSSIVQDDPGAESTFGIFGYGFPPNAEVEIDVTDGAVFNSFITVAQSNGMISYETPRTLPCPSHTQTLWRASSNGVFSNYYPLICAFE